MDFVYFIFPISIAYLVGSIPFGLILTRVFTNTDIRNIGSGNIGATNVLRSGNKAIAALTLILDVLKGAAAVVFVSYSLPDVCAWIDCEGDCACVQYGFYELNYDYAKFFIGGLIAIIGHCFPIWLKFKGGKGVATALGVLLAAVPIVGLVACATWLVSAFAFKISSLAALIAIGGAPIVTFFIYGGAPAVVCLLIALLVFWRHKENIQRLLKGAEPRIGAK